MCLQIRYTAENGNGLTDYDILAKTKVIRKCKCSSSPHAASVLCTEFALSLAVPSEPWTANKKGTFFEWERYVIIFLCSKNCACGHDLIC